MLKWLFNVNYVRLYLQPPTPGRRLEASYFLIPVSLSSLG
jgi:hypothetical protein